MFHKHYSVVIQTLNINKFKFNKIFKLFIYKLNIQNIF